MPINYEYICLNVADIARNTGLRLRKMRDDAGIKITQKGKNDFVTQFDRAVEQSLVELLSAMLPSAGFIAEEGTSDKRGERFNWVIDPIDGTTNFIHGLFPYCISIALMEGSEVVVGVIYEVGFDECFYAWKHGKAMLNGNEIHVSRAATVADSLIATGFPYTDFGLIDRFMDSLQYFMQKSHGMRRLGSAAADLAYVACGRVDAFYEYGLKPWDVAAGALIVQQAGGNVADFTGNNGYIFGRQLVAANSLVFDEFMQITAMFLQ
ncbi:MAG: inositol monophosphatase [Cytophagaceae bacterium]|jgi:myo-inositol-1(or 4)-monophosphatase|nr:inositol monophosphatase [Cytophagaceae bacterium]